MATFVNDTFTEGGSNVNIVAHTGETGATWTEHPAYATGDLGVSATGDNVFINVTNINCSYYASGTPSSPDYEVVADMFWTGNSATQDTNLGVTGRTDPSAATLYLARYSTIGWQLYKFVAGTATQLGSTVSETLTVTAQVKLKMVGSTIELYKKGEATPTITVTDTSITLAGKAGIRGSTSNGTPTASAFRWDNFSATDLGVGAEIALAGALTGSASVSASLTTLIQFLGSLTGSGSVAGNLTTNITLTALLSGAATAQGNLTTLIQLMGALQGTATTSGALTIVGDLLAAISGSSSASGNLTTAIRLAASVAGSSATNGDLLTGIALMGSLTGAGVVTGNLTVPIWLQAAIQGAAVATGDLATEIKLYAAANGSAVVTATLTTSGTVLILYGFTLSAITRGFTLPAQIRGFKLPR